MMRYDDQKLIDDMAYAFSLGATIKIACDYVGLNPGNYHEWQIRAKGGQEPFVQIFDKFRKARARGDVGALERMKKEREEGSWQAAAWLLERRHPASYGANAHLRELNEKIDILLKDKDNGQQTETETEPKAEETA